MDMYLECVNPSHIFTLYTDECNASKTAFSDMSHGLDSVTTTEDVAHHIEIFFSRRNRLRNTLVDVTAETTH